MAAGVAAETKSNKIAIRNFGCINENYYRGAQPQNQDYASLASFGIKTVIDLQRDGDPNEQQLVESNGMKFIRFRMTTTDRPDSKTVAQFLKIVNDPANQPVYVHCAGGRHRTGVMTAIYRLTHDSWNPDQAYGEMKQYEFDKGFGHGALKSYVYSYFTRLDPQPTLAGKEPVTASAGSTKN
jgi:protein tyrosine/serine phosphatase